MGIEQVVARERFKIKSRAASEKSKIDYNAEKEIGAVNYFGDFINSNYEKLVDALRDDINFESEMYENVSSMIIYLNVMGKDIARLYTSRENNDPLDIKLGLTKYLKKSSGSIDFYAREFTEKGIEVINNYREITEEPLLYSSRVSK